MKKIIFLISLLIGSNVKSFSATNVSGVITTNTTWTTTGSPYIIVGDMAVDSGVTLTIQPGVQVRFDGNYNMYIDGKLLAIGTVTDSITFTSNKTIPATGDWRGISFRPKSNSDTCKMRYCYVEYAFRGVYSDGSSPKISNSVFRKNNNGILVNWNVGYPVIINNLITQNTGMGISGGSSSLPATTPSGEITGNEVTYNPRGFYGSNATSWKISGNNFSYNTDGVYLTGNVSYYNINSNTITGNSNYGIYFASGGTLVNPFQNNLIAYNNIGMYVANLDGVVIHNTIAYNAIGVQHSWTSSTSTFSFHYNCIANNSSYNYKTLSASTTPNVSVTNNWWGTTNTMSIDTFIYDYYDNLVTNKVLYTPVLTQPDASCQSVSPPTPCGQPTNVANNNTSLTNTIVSWTATPGATSYEYYVALSPSTPPVSGNQLFNTSISLNVTNNKLYDFCVRTKCSSNPTPSGWSCITFSIPAPACLPPASITPNFVWDDNMTFSWDPMIAATAYEYSVMPSPSTPPTNGTPTTGKTAFVNNLSPGVEYNICVRSVCGTQKSLWICDTVTTTTTGINRISGNHVRSYPNPVKSSFTIEADASFYDADIIVTNLLGATVYTGKMNGTRQTIDMSFHPAGLYFMKCATSKGSQTIKLVKE